MSDVEVIPVQGPVTVSVARGHPPAHAAPDTPTAREWSRLASLNPRLFSDPILSVVSIDADLGRIHARRESYQRLAVQPRVRTGVRLLSVTGILIATDDDGGEHVLLGRRGEGVRVYADMWEFGPSGGVGCPPAPITDLSEHDLLEHLADEVAEEVGLEVTGGRAVAIVRDHAAFSDDVCFRIDAGRLDHARAVTRPANWEYSETRWVATSRFAAFCAEHAGRVIVSTIETARTLGW